VLGKVLNTEELKILLSFIRYLGMTPDVIAVLVNYCKDRARQKGGRAPSLRAIEKEAYYWAERGIETMEEAAAFIQTQNAHNALMAHIKHLLQIRGRRLTTAEERYASEWAEMGFEDGAILMAYERTCINTGGLKWPYLNSILKRWHEKGLHTVEQINSGDQKAAPKQERRDLSPDEYAAIQKMLQEG
jgi:DnaD/phage-associated family protein